MSEERVNMEYTTIIYEAGPVTRIIHNEPQKHNVMGPVFEREFKDALKRFDHDPEAKVAVTLANGKHFAAGHDIGSLSKKQSWEKKEKTVLMEAEWRKLNDPRRFIYPMWEVSKPLIVGAQGASLAAGANFVMMHDIVVMGESAYLGFEITRVSGAAGSFMEMWMGYRKAFELLACGWNVGAQELYRLNAINKVVPDDQIEAAAMKYAEIISFMPLETLRLTKQSFRLAQALRGAREVLWHNDETNTLVHLVNDEREKQFYRIMKEQGMKAALQFRDEPFEKFGYDRQKPTII
ncbi:MAG: enoyl-CoA hydratase/isomerase family protein [Deltaproteobacteria bacterium]|nr:enoyl-CoA hydratase/isomerase family protein [Deltaproteobacteria bacterium]